MTNSDKTILVLGATGKQGGAVARKLLADGWSVRAVSRHPDQPAAQELQKKGATVVQANMDNQQSLLEAMRGVYGVYSVQPLYSKDPEKEIQHGKTVADVAKQVGVSHFVYGSAGGAERDSGVPHFETKWQVEKYVRAIDLPFTILRPTGFMENFIGFTQAHEQKLMIQGFMDVNTKLQIISVQDIGAFAAIAFNNPEKYKGMAIEIAGDEVTLSEVAKVFSQVFDTPCEVLESARDQFQKNKMFEWLETDGYQADIPSLRKVHPDLLDLSTWVKNSGWDPFV
ncbi:NmrA/HSCARG family protein [Alkalihalobacillus sp. TS-13]|uniref:NmrA/HSCARG family protein n=1 Tax=Alkalihalobacillus sp. TS-13 TaxID=2842455 RepID=UPI001C868C2A|nr:NmrA/HSCARG family protein [Alkalihalobacillus sp. TS-13]